MVKKVKNPLSYSYSTTGNKLNCTASSVQKLLPAMQALTRDTQVPVSIALNTRDEISLFLDGQIEAEERK